MYHGYLEQLRNFRVLDPACGSGNFLYLSLHALKDLEHVGQLDAEALGFQKQLLLSTGTDNVLGMEINEYAAELGRVTVWIGDLQWSQRNGRLFDKNPILRSLDGIQHKDALLNTDGSETKWAKADVIVGNPPFLGDKKCSKNWAMITLQNCVNATKGVWLVAQIWFVIGLKKHANKSKQAKLKPLVLCQPIPFAAAQIVPFSITFAKNTRF